jgi:hypothetical protein
MSVTIEKINDNYAWGRYGGGEDVFEVIIRADGYINATELAKKAQTAMGREKRVYHWLETASTKELVDELCNQEKRRRDEIVCQVSGGAITYIRGTYLHPLLIPHVAIWMSPRFAIYVSRIMNEHTARELQKLVADNDLLSAENSALHNTVALHETETKVIAKARDRAAERADNIENALYEIISRAKDTDQHVYNLLTQNAALMAVCLDTNRQITLLNQKISIAKPLCTEPVAPPLQEVVVFVPRTTQAYTDYKFIRVQARGERAALETARKDGFDVSRAIRIADVPNAGKLVNKIFAAFFAIWHESDGRVYSVKGTRIRIGMMTREEFVALLVELKRNALLD